ncbi:MAG: gliding motility-associated C-terminal domain-containing protein [Bacteroidales bacterium]
MSMRFIHNIVVLLLILGFYSINGYSQIGADNVFSEKTWYSSTDSIYVFCTTNSSGGSLYAIDSTSLGGYTFQWLKYNSTTSLFDIPLTEFTYNNDSTQTTILNLESGGYKAILTNADTIQEYIAWVYNNLNLSIDLQIVDPFDCEILELFGTPNFETGMLIYNPADSTNKMLSNSKKNYSWEFESDGEVNIPEYDYSYTSTGSLPLEDTKCKLILIDRFGCSVADSVTYTAIATKAEMQLTHLDKDGNEISSSDSTLTGEAPMIVRFQNKSKRGADFVWFFGDTIVKNDLDYIYTSDVNLQPEHTYYYTENPGGKKYTVKLNSTSSYGCKDSVYATINLDPSEIEFPNVFSPDNDGPNDVFKLDPEKYKSIRSFKITIFNRVGQLMHEYEGDIHDWPGWDGKVRGNDASEGTYFFVVEVTGWDNVTYNNSKLNGKGDSYFGFVSLYRDK